MLLALLGAVIGLFLGDIAAGNRLGRTLSSTGGYAELSANPDAAATNSLARPACSDCADSYGVAIRLRAERENDAYRELGAVDLDWPAPPAEDEYRYGGRFPDIDPATEPVVQPTTATVDPASVADSPAGESDEPR